MTVSNSVRTQSLPTGATLVTITGHQPGPVLALLGGVHGDEDDGVLVIQRLLCSLLDTPLTGTVRVVAPANPAAFAAHTRTSPLDGMNLARAFPGDANGTPSHQLAAALTTELIGGADLLVDLHSAGTHYDMPLFAGYVHHGSTAERAHCAALAFSTPLVWVHDSCPPGRSLTVAHEAGIPAVYVECSGGGAIKGMDHERYLSGLTGVMRDLGMLARDGELQSTRSEPDYVFGDGDLDAGAAALNPGWFVSDTTAGATLDAGAPVGRLFDFTGQLLDTIRVTAPGRVMFLRRTARVQAGDVLYTCARDGQAPP